MVISRVREELRKSHAACRQDRYKHGGDGQVLPPVSVHRLWPSDRDACSLRLSSSSGIFRRERDLPLFSQSITQLVDRTQTSPLVPPDSRTNMGRWRQEHPVVLGDRPGLDRLHIYISSTPAAGSALFAATAEPPSSLPLPRPIIRSSSGEIGNLTRGRCNV